MNRNRTVCFTGHRNIKSATAIERQLVEIVKGLVAQGYTHFLAGGARGFDSMAARAVLQLKKNHPQINLRLILPFPNLYERENGWSEEDIENYHAILGAADDVVYMGQQYKRGLYYKRDRYMVDNAAVCVAYQRRKTGGTAYTVNYAAERAVKLIMV